MEPTKMLEWGAAEMFGSISAVALAVAFWLAVGLPLVWAAANALKRFCPRP